LVFMRVLVAQVGTFLASQADDKSVIIWRVSDWAQVARISKPFERWVTMTFSLRQAHSQQFADVGSILLIVPRSPMPTVTAPAFMSTPYVPPAQVP